MTHDQAMKLLGGYATNSLSEEERNALLAAALEDQELFDALEREQALKDVFDDRVARAEIRQALELPEIRSAAWWTRWWAWGGASAAAAALAISVVWLGGLHRAAQRETPIQISQVTKTEAPDASGLTARAPQAEAKPVTPARAPAKAKTRQEPADALREKTLREKTKKQIGKDVPPVSAGTDVAVNLERAESKQEAARPVPGPASAPASPANAISASTSTAPKGEVFVTAQSAQLATADTPINNRSLDKLATLESMKKQATMQAVPGRRGLVAGKALAPSLSYTLLRRDSDGREVQVLPGNVQESESVHVTLKPPFAGTLSLYLLRNGASSLAAPLLKVAASQTYVIPAVPITVKAGDVLQLELQPSSGGQRSVLIPLGKP